MRRNVKFGRHVVALVAACVLWVGLSGAGWADLRIVSEAEGQRMETLFKRNRIAAPLADGSSSVLYCDAGELALIGSSDVGRYWRGTLDELKDSLAALFDGQSEASAEGQGGMPDLGALLGGLFGGSAGDEEIDVRISKAGQDTIAGYAADHYVVETNKGGRWQPFEEVWLSGVLLNEVKAEVGACVELMLEIQAELEGLSLFGMDELEAVMASSEYRTLMTSGFPLRNKQTMSLFGMTMEFSDEVIEVNRDAVPEDMFVIPSGYVRVDSPLELLGEM